MTIACSQDSTPEERQNWMNGIKDLLQLFKSNPKAAALLKEAQAGQLSEEQLMMELIKLQPLEQK